MGRHLSETYQRTAEGMARLLAEKREREQARKAPKPTAQSDQRKYGKRGWTWTP